MNISNTYIKILLAALVLAALILPAAAWDRTEWVDGGDGYMINNVCIDVTIGINDTIENSSAIVSVWEWKNDAWTQIGSSRNLSMNGTLDFSASDGNYTMKIIDFRGVGRGSAKIEFWTNSNVTHSAAAPGGHTKAVGVGKPELKITKTAAPQNVSVGDLILVTIYVENTGQYEARNVTISDGALQYPLVLNNTVTNNTQSQTIGKGENRTFLAYQLKSMEPGTFNLSGVTASASNSVGTSYTYSNNAAIRIEVEEIAALVFTNHFNSSTVDSSLQSKIPGTITIKNTGTLPANNLSIDFLLQPNSIINVSGGDGKIELDGRTRIEIDRIMPNNEKVIEYMVTANSPGRYEITMEYTYQYNGTKKEEAGGVIVYRAADNPAISKLLDNWYLLLIPLILIVVGVFFVLKRYNEYKF